MSKLDDIVEKNWPNKRSDLGKSILKVELKDLFNELIDEVVDDSFYSDPLKQKVAEL